MKPAIFLDRDGTLIESIHYLSRPDQVRLLPRAADGLRDWERMGYLRILVTNQAAVSKGILSLFELEQVHARLGALLAAEGAALDAIYFTTLAQRGTDRTLVEHPDRKPGPGLLLRAAREHHVDLARSWMIGDSLSDTVAGRNAKCKGCVLVKGGLSSPEEERHPSVDFVVNDLRDAVRVTQQAGSPSEQAFERTPREKRKARTPRAL